MSKNITDRFFGLDNPKNQGEGVSLLTTVRSNIEQAIVESKLRGENIPYLLKERGSGSSMKIITGFSIYGTDIYVLDEDLDRATELLIPELDTEDEEGDSDDIGDDNTDADGDK